MINRILNFYLDSLKAKGISYDKVFEDSEFNRISDLVIKTNLPTPTIMLDYIDTNTLPLHINKLYNNFEDLCYSYNSTFITVPDYNCTKNIVKMLIEKLYKRCLAEDVTVPNLLYIDTESLVSDLGRLMSIDKQDNLEDMTYSLQNSRNIIYKEIYIADYVFWDKFDFNYSPYFNNYIYEIIKNRYNHCLNNMFFCDEIFDKFIEKTQNKNLMEVLNIKTKVSIIKEICKLQMIGGDN